MKMKGDLRMQEIQIEWVRVKERESVKKLDKEVGERKKNLYREDIEEIDGSRSKWTGIVYKQRNAKEC